MKGNLPVDRSFYGSIAYDVDSSNKAKGMVNGTELMPKPKQQQGK